MCEASDSSRRLTPKQHRFLREYLTDLNATQAAVRAGYSPKTARVIGSENLTKPFIAAAIRKAQVALAERTQVTQDYVIMALLRLVNPRLDDPSPAQAAVAARGLELLGRHLGMFQERSGAKPEPGILEGALAAMTVEELVALVGHLRQRRGLVVEGVARELPAASDEGTRSPAG